LVSPGFVVSAGLARGGRALRCCVTRWPRRTAPRAAGRARSLAELGIAGRGQLARAL